VFSIGRRDVGLADWRLAISMASINDSNCPLNENIRWN
jgi:hypothetical protein